jgi:hypothetical protein
MYRSKMRCLVGHVCLHFFGFILEFKQFLSVVGDVPIESEASVVTFFNLNDMSAQEVGLHVCIHRNKCVYMRVCDYLHLFYVWKKNTHACKRKIKLRIMVVDLLGMYNGTFFFKTTFIMEFIIYLFDHHIKRKQIISLYHLFLEPYMSITGRRPQEKHHIICI